MCLHSMVVIADTNSGLFALSLEQLLDVEVSTVSKRNEPMSEAPGVITVISAAEIKRFGARNIKDILLRLPNFYMFDSATWSASGATLRAGATQHLNNHVLYLIDGRPLRESQNGGLHSDINLLFPVDALARIEVIRGAGSVLYGSNAFSGTVNFITKSKIEKVTAKLQTNVGSDLFWANSASVKSNLGDDGSISVFVNNLKDDGAKIQANDEGGDSGEMSLFREGKSAYIQADYRGFSVNILKNELLMPMVSGAFLWGNRADLSLKREYVDIGYELDFNADWSSSFHYTRNNHHRDIERPSGIDTHYVANGYLYEFTLLGQLNNDLSVVAGAVIEEVRGDLGSQGGPYKSKREGIYGQLDYQLQSSKISVGLQWNKAQSTTEISPRLAFIHRFNSRWSTKLLHSEAFRSPYGSELFFQSNFLQGDTELLPERINTTEAQLIFVEPDVNVKGTIYHSKTSDTIGRSLKNGVNTFVNLPGYVEFDGIELEGSWTINPQWRFQGSYTYQINQDEDGLRDVMAASRMMAKFGLAYRSKGVEVGVWNSHFGKVSKLENNHYYNIHVVNPEAKAYSLLSLNLSIDLSELLENRAFNGIQLSVYADNLLNEDVWFADLSRFKVNTYPQSHARGIFGAISYSF